MPIRLGPFWSYVDKTGDCWLWNGTIDNLGYGRYGTRTSAHRVAWELSNGRKIDPEKEIHHKCENKKCVNPSHLEEVTRSQHLQYQPRRHNSSKTHCSNGHPFSKENTYIDKFGYRSCRECKRLYYHRRKHA